VPKRATVIPSARRLIGSLRDLGYETTEAVADLIDNSIAAGAHDVDVDLTFVGDESSIRISDNGRGMNAAQITEAMRYGAARHYEDDDLGKFGLGLKTASLSQCRRLTVASRTSKTQARIEARQLDLAYVEQHDDWDVLILGASERPARLIEPLQKTRGTVVLWEDLDRILVYRDPWGGWAERRMKTLAEELELHLGMVFHRFLAGEVPRKKLAIRINGNRIDPWDPFARDEAATVELRSIDVPLNTADASGVVRVEPFILPPKASFSNLNAWTRASGPKNWNPQQGFYIYRANRLIQSGGWSGMRTIDEHTKLSRIGLLFGPELDHAFDVNVAKMRVKLPQELRESIDKTVSEAARSARAQYDAKPDGGPRRPAAPLRAAPAQPSTPTAAPSTDPPEEDPKLEEQADATSDGRGAATATAATMRDALEAAAVEAGEVEALAKIIEALTDHSPEVARDLGW
jgi:hypothetical protein